jgi:hypothetical protein
MQISTIENHITSREHALLEKRVDRRRMDDKMNCQVILYPCYWKLKFIILNSLLADVALTGYLVTPVC